MVGTDVTQAMLPRGAEGCQNADLALDSLTNW